LLISERKSAVETHLTASFPPNSPPPRGITPNRRFLLVVVLRPPPKPAKDAVDDTREKQAKSRLKEAKVLMMIALRTRARSV
jgi:hypothetical protein